MPGPRKQMDTPAMAFSVVAGLVLVAISIVPVVRLWEEESGFNVGFSERAVGAEEGSAAGRAGSVSVEVPVEDLLVSTVSVDIDPCADTFLQQVQQPVQITLTLYEGDAEIGTRTLVCNDVGSGPELVAEVAPQPERDTIRAADEESGLDAVWAADGEGNRTATYRLNVTWARPASPLDGLPLPGPAQQDTFGARALLVVESWHARVSADEEVVR